MSAEATIIQEIPQSVSSILELLEEEDDEEEDGASLHDDSKNICDHRRGRRDRRRSSHHHVELTGDVLDWLHRKFDNRKWGSSSTAISATTIIINARNKFQQLKKKILFSSDIMKQLLVRSDIDDNMLHLIGKMSETHEERIEITSLRGNNGEQNNTNLLAQAIGRVASSSSCDDSNRATHTRRSNRRSNDQKFNWLWVLNNHIFYISKKDILQQRDLLTNIVNCLDDSNSNNYDKLMAIQIIQRIAMRGCSTPSIKSYLNPFIDRIVNYCTCLINRSKISNSRSQCTRLVYQSCITLAALSHLTKNSTYVIPAVKYLKQFGRGMSVIARISAISLSIEMPSRKHLLGNMMRPGETLNYYLILSCSSDDIGVQYVGCIALAVILDSVCPNVFNNCNDVNDNNNPNDNGAISSRLYTKHVIEILQTQQQQQNDDTRIAQEEEEEKNEMNYVDFEEYGNGDDNEEVSLQLLRGLRPFSLVANCALRLGRSGAGNNKVTTTNDNTSKEIQKMGMFVKQKIPLHVLQQTVWCPNMHRFFDRTNQNIVLCMLLLINKIQKRCNNNKNSLPILPIDVLITHILPFACCYNNNDDSNNKEETKKESKSNNNGVGSMTLQRVLEM